MHEEPGSRGALGRLAPIAFVAGLVLLGLSLLVFTLAATGAGPERVEYHESWTHNGTSTLVYPLPIAQGYDERVNVAFEFPQANGTAYALRCRDHEAIRQGEAPDAPEMRVGGRTGSFSLALSPDLHLEPIELDDEPFGAPPRPLPPHRIEMCPFLYVAFQWEAGDDPNANRPQVTIERESILLAGPAGAFSAIAGILGVALSAAGGIAWGRRLNRERAVVPAHEDESAAEALLHVIERSGAWLERTRRYLLLAGVLGLFLWYPVLLPWTYRLALRGTSANPLPWLVSGGVLVVLLAGTALWASEYLRLDRELVAWRERIARLRARETALLEGFDGPG